MEIELEKTEQNGDEENNEGEQNKRFIIVDEHQGHYVKNLNQVLSQAEQEKNRLRDSITE